MSGFFPVMMFGLPAACFAMYRATPLANRKRVGGMLASMALTSFLTGVTEPIEFTFMFQAPLLYAIHAMLTGVSMALMDVLGVKLGFGFSAGLFDYLINFQAAQKPLLLIPIGIAYGLIYYIVFSIGFRLAGFSLPQWDDDEHSGQSPGADGRENESERYISALGGAQNLTAVSACTTRLRLEVKDSNSVNERVLLDLGAKGVLRPGKTSLQVVIGPQAERVADAIKLSLGAIRTDVSAAQHSAEKSDAFRSINVTDLPSDWLLALGGEGNVLGCERVSENRMQVRLKLVDAVDRISLSELGLYLVRYLEPSKNNLTFVFDGSADKI